MFSDFLGGCGGFSNGIFVHKTHQQALQNSDRLLAGCQFLISPCFTAGRSCIFVTLEIWWWRMMKMPLSSRDGAADAAVLTATNHSCSTAAPKQITVHEHFRSQP